MILDSLSTGLSRTQQAARFVWLAYACNLLLALPLGAAMAVQLREGIGNSEAGETLLQGFDHLWWSGFNAEAKGLAATFEPGVVGIGGVLKALDAQVTANLFDLHGSVIAAGVAYLLVWVFLTAGFLASFTGGAEGFLAGAARVFPRVLALAAVAWLAYVVILDLVLGVGGRIVGEFTRETIDERVHFAWVLGKYAVVWSLVWATSLVFDYAKIAAVARPDEPLRLSFQTGLALVRRRPRTAFGLSAALFGLGAAVLLLFAIVAPGAGQHNGFKIAIAFVISQTYILARVACRCATIGAQADLATKLWPARFQTTSTSSTTP